MLLFSRGSHLDANVQRATIYEGNKPLVRSGGQSYIRGRRWAVSIDARR
jgi:hypothetical protein